MEKLTLDEYEVVLRMRKDSNFASKARRIRSSFNLTPFNSASSFQNAEHKGDKPKTFHR